jgi:dipeptidyl aminopeptidase/acylaminoacyl peptidase
MFRRALLLILLFALPLFAAEIHQTAISPDGKSVAWSDDHGLYVAAVAGGEAKKIADAREFAWSPDAKRLAYIGAGQLWVSTLTAPAKKLTSLKGTLAAPQWSPDGKAIAILFIENSARAAGPLVAMSRAVGEIEEHVDEQRVVLVDAATGATRTVTPADMYVYEYDWSPDGKRLAAIAAPGSGDNNWWIAQLQVVDVAAAKMTPVYKPEYQLCVPRWSPDGTRIAFIEGLMSDAGVNGGDLFVIDAGGGPPRNLTPSAPFSVASLRWSGKDELTFGANMSGDSALAVVPASGGDPEIVWRAPETITEGDVIGASFSRDGKSSAVIRSSFTAPAEVWAGKTGAWRQVSHVNAGIKERPAEVKKIEWSSDQFHPYGWLLMPVARQASSPAAHPMVVWVHGGPASASLSRWPREEALALLRRGYFVFYPNPRGSFGAGEAFTRANVKDFGYGDLRDILSGVDEVTRSNPVDAKRVGIWGWSYGGYMTMWTVTQTERFRAAVAGAGIANWQSYYGENDIDRWMIPYFGASVYDDPAVYAKSSPITFIKQTKTPTLILVGERDGEVPAPQSFEFWHALKTLGVPTKLVVYPDEGHRIAKPEHKKDIERRVVGWFDQWMGAEP